MRKSKGKKVLSYIKDVLLETTSSEYNEVLSVNLSKGRYQLCTSGAVYSYEDKYVNFFETFKKIDWYKIKVEKVLILGLGLASIPQMLEQNFDKDFEYYAVEIDSEIIRLAEKYVLDDLKSPIQIFEMDAELFVDITTEKFELIIVDIFDNDIVPVAFESKAFLEKTAGLLSRDGVLLYNRLNVSNVSKKETLDYYESVFKIIFPAATALYIKDNIILINRVDMLE